MEIMYNCIKKRCREGWTSVQNLLKNMLVSNYTRYTCMRCIDNGIEHGNQIAYHFVNWKPNFLYYVLYIVS